MEKDKLKMLRPFVMAKVEKLLRIARRIWPDYSITIAEAYRTQERQDMLYANGPSTTTVRVSMHTKRLAVDIHFTRAGRKLKYEEAPYLGLGELAEAMGFRWGGRWKVPFDPWHFELKE